VIAVAQGAAVGARAAAPATPSAYRAYVNGVCRSYTPRISALETSMDKAQRAKDGHAFGVALGKLIVLTLAQDARVEKTPVPPPLRAQMAPILRKLRAADGHLRTALSNAVAGKPSAMLSELEETSRIAAPLNRLLDRAGLRDCGSNQS
jgi:hypothetical protein